jgi:hypothetical protein
MLEKGEHVGSAAAIRAAAKQLRVLTNVADVALDNMADVNCALYRAPVYVGGAPGTMHLRGTPLWVC